MGKQDELNRAIRMKLSQTPDLSNRAIARALNCSPNTVIKVRKTMPDAVQNAQAGQVYNWFEHPYVKANPDRVAKWKERDFRAANRPGVLDEMVSIGSISPRRGEQSLRRKMNEQRLAELGIQISEKDIIFSSQDLLGGLPDIEDESCDLCLVDPPYSSEYLPLYKALSTLAARALKPGGSLVVVCGQHALPDKLEALCSDSRLRYWWTLTVIGDRFSKALHWLKIQVRSKLIIHIVKGPTYNGKMYTDLIKLPPSHRPEKDIHEWAQPISLFSDIIDRFGLAGTGATILDPCCGRACSCGIAAVLAGCKFTGNDINEEYVKVAKRRVLDALYNPAAYKVDDVITKI